MTSRLLAIALGLLLAGCLNPIASVTHAAKPLSYVGNISFGVPALKRNNLVIPMQYTGGEWLMNSALSAYKVDARVTGSSIEFTVVVAALGSGYSEAGYELRLPVSLKGKYQLVYRDPDGALHPLRTIDL